MTDSPIGKGFMAPFSAGPLLSPIDSGFGGPAAFAAAVGGRFMSANARVRPVEQTLAADGSVVSVTPQVNLSIEVDASRPAPVSPARMEVHREAGRRETVRSVERHTETTRVVETPLAMHERLVQRFERVERDVRMMPALDQSARPSVEAPSRAAGAMARPGAEPMVYHRPPPPAPAPVQPVEIRRELPRFEARPADKAISPREVSRVADEVIAVLNRQSVAWRERFGRG